MPPPRKRSHSTSSLSSNAASGFVHALFITFGIIGGACVLFCFVSILIIHRKRSKAEKARAREQRTAERNEESVNIMLETLARRNSKLSNELEHLRKFADRVHNSLPNTFWASDSRPKPLVYRIGGEPSEEGETLQLVPPRNLPVPLSNIDEDPTCEDELASMNLDGDLTFRK